MVTVTELKPEEVETVDRHLPLSRLDQEAREGSTYLIAWEDDRPVGHAHIAWDRTHLGFAEIQDVFVLPELRHRGIATQLTEAAEELARARGWDRVSLSVSQGAMPPRATCTRSSATSTPESSRFACSARSCSVAVRSMSTTRSSTSSRISDAAVHPGQIPSDPHPNLVGPAQPRRRADSGRVNTIRR
jgi:predicted GNAT family acetyltransferase